MTLYQPESSGSIPASCHSDQSVKVKPKLIEAWANADVEERAAFARFVGPATLWDLIEPLI